MAIRGVRGATSVESNTKQAILDETHTLLSELITRNQIDPEDIASIFFSVTPDLNNAFPAEAARKMGLQHTPLLCLTEIDVPNSLAGCIRILMHVNSTKKQSEILPIYLKRATALRPELSQKQNG